MAAELQPGEAAEGVETLREYVADYEPLDLLRDDDVVRVRPVEPEQRHRHAADRAVRNPRRIRAESLPLQPLHPAGARRPFREHQPSAATTALLSAAGPPGG